MAGGLLDDSFVERKVGSEMLELFRMHWDVDLAWQHERARRLMMSESMTEAKGARVCPKLAGFTAESTESTTKRCPSP